MTLLAQTGYIVPTRNVPVRGLIVNKAQRTINNETIRRRTNKIQHEMEDDGFKDDGSTVFEAGGKMLLLMLLQWSMSAEEEGEGLDETGLEANETYDGLGFDETYDGLEVGEGVGWDGMEVDEGSGWDDLEVDGTPISSSTAF